MKVKSVKDQPYDSKGNYRGPAIKNPKSGKKEWAGVKAPPSVVA